MSRSDEPFRTLQREALDWLTRVTSGHATVAELRAFKAWRGRSEAHDEAYLCALHVWRASEAAARDVATEQDRALLAASPRMRRANIDRRGVLVGGFAATAGGVGAIAALSPLGVWPSLQDLLAEYHTGTGEQRQINVTDKVFADLNTRTAIGRRGDKNQTVELIAGEVSVSSARSSSQPFTILAGAGSVRSAQAKFDVRYESGVACVTCLEGTVQVKTAESAVTLHASQQTVYFGRHMGPISIIDPEVVMAWQHGLLIFRDEPLSQVVKEVNRYWFGRIIILDPSLGQRRVTARIELSRIGEVISYVRTVMGAEIRNLPGGIVFLG